MNELEELINDKSRELFSTEWNNRIIDMLTMFLDRDCKVHSLSTKGFDDVISNLLEFSDAISFIDKSRIDVDNNSLLVVYELVKECSKTDNVLSLLFRNIQNKMTNMLSRRGLINIPCEVNNNEKLKKAELARDCSVLRSACIELSTKQKSEFSKMDTEARLNMVAKLLIRKALGK
jgi:hypothetical protein